MSQDHPRMEPKLSPDVMAVPQRHHPKHSHKPKRRFSLMSFLFWLLFYLALLPPLTVLALRWLPPPTTAFMLQSEKPVDYRWVPSAQIADAARKAVVAAEDQKFWTHNGFDFEAMEKAYLRNKKSRRVRGASTITQQVAKNLFLWPGGGYFRKGIEATFTLLIETLWSKPRILEVYLNIAEFGPGIYGVEAAAQKHFGKKAAQLSAQEAAQLAAVLPSPRRWSARSPGPYVQARARWIMGQIGYRRAPEPELEPEIPESELEAEAVAMPSDPESTAEPVEEAAEPAPADPAEPAEETQPEIVAPTEAPAVEH